MDLRHQFSEVRPLHDEGIGEIVDQALLLLGRELPVATVLAAEHRTGLAHVQAHALPQDQAGAQRAAVDRHGAARAVRALPDVGVLAALEVAGGARVVEAARRSRGAGRLGAGAYLSDNLYTDFTVNTEGDTEVNLNLDVNDNFTVRGTVDGRGETGIGLFFERDY